MNEMQAHGLLIPVGSMPIEVWIDKNNSLDELQNFVNGNVDVLRVLGNGVDLWFNKEYLFNGSQPNRAIYATKHMEEVGYLVADPSTGYKEYIHIKYGIEPDRFQLQNEQDAGDKHEKSTKSLAEVATEARESSLVLGQSKGNHDDSGSDIGNSRPIDREYPISH